MTARRSNTGIKAVPWLLTFVIGVAAGYTARGRTMTAPKEGRQVPLSVCFSPHGGCTAAVVRELEQARNTIEIQAYSFTSKEIAAAAVREFRKGVKVTAVLDASNRTGRYSAATFLTHAGIPVYIDDQHAIAHNKVIVIDDRTVITGSFNFTKAAEERNAENLLIIRDPAVAGKYRRNFDAHLGHSERYEP